MNTSTSAPIARLSFSRKYSAYAAVPADRDAERLMSDLAALPVSGAADSQEGGRLAHLRHRLGAAFHHHTAAA